MSAITERDPCPICLQATLETNNTVCCNNERIPHIFHKACAVEWAKTRPISEEQITCLLCREGYFLPKQGSSTGNETLEERARLVNLVFQVEQNIQRINQRNQQNLQFINETSLRLQELEKQLLKAGNDDPKELERIKVLILATDERIRQSELECQEMNRLTHELLQQVLPLDQHHQEQEHIRVCNTRQRWICIAGGATGVALSLTQELDVRASACIVLTSMVAARILVTLLIKLNIDQAISNTAIVLRGTVGGLGGMALGLCITKVALMIIGAGTSSIGREMGI